VLGLVLNAKKTPDTPDGPATGPLLDAVSKIINASLTNTMCYNRLAYLCDTFGGRPSGSANLENAIQWIYNTMLTVDNLDNVTLENVTVPHWVRGNESAAMLAPFYRSLSILSLGGRYVSLPLGALLNINLCWSVGTGPGGLTAQVLVVKSFDELRARSTEALNKIVLFNAAWNATYGNSVVYRVSSD